MSITEIISLISNNPNMVYMYYLVIVAVAVIASIYVKRENYKPPFTYLFSTLIYAVAIPGLVSAILVFYGFFFQKLNFLNVNLLVYFLPIIVLLAVFVGLNKAVGLKNIPGFKRISGLFMMIFLALFISYIIQKMFFGVIFFGKFTTLLVIFAVILVALKIGWDKLVK